MSTPAPGPGGIALGVNIDHVATLRQARRGRSPDPLTAALVAEQSGADSITLHLREDRRHIQDRDVAVMREALQTRMNLEMAVTDEMIAVARRVRPQDCCLVPESRQEITTEGGLDVIGRSARVAEACAALRHCGRPGIDLHRSRRPADRGRAPGGRSGDRTAHRRLRECRRRGTGGGIRASALGGDAGGLPRD